nr:DUF87 domain-containing protein [uncultured Flavobacterium sp.]
MTLKARIILLIFQLLVLLACTYFVTGQVAVNEIWFFSGLLAIVINPILLEPWYPKSYDTLSNSIIALLLCFVVTANIAKVGWIVLKVFLICLIIVSILKLAYQNENNETSKKLYAFFPLFKIGTAVVIYSLVFWLSVLELYLPTNSNFWILAICWSVLTFTRFINWELYFLELTDKPLPIYPLGIIGPSTLLVTTRKLNAVGTRVTVSTASCESQGTIVKRINRTDDIYGQIQLDDSLNVDTLVSKQSLNILSQGREVDSKYIGNVDEGTSTNIIVFDTNQRIKIGETIYLRNLDEVVFYQIIQAEIFKVIIKGGAQLDRKVKAIQIGSYSLQDQSLKINKYLPALSTPIYIASHENWANDNLQPLENKFTLGYIKNSKLPINLDLIKIKESHMAILGMTGMGKTTLCHKLIQELAKTRRVIIMDQTGEFVSKLGYTKFEKDDDLLDTGVSVCEPTGNPAESALKYLNHLMEIAKEEYKNGIPKSRVLVIDEAHQFIPEPAGLGFGSPGREESIRFGLNMMQVRKYGISIIFISQRTAVVSKSALSQCENLIAFKSVDQTGLDYLEGILGCGSKDLLPTLSRGEALVYGPAIDIDKSLMIETVQ